MNFDAVMQVTSFVASVLTAIASILIPIILYRSQKQKATLDYIKSGRDSWIQIDLALIGKPDLLRHADSILAPGSEHLSDEQREKIWLSLMILNVAFSDFIGLKYGYHEREEKKTLVKFISNLMQDETTYNLSQNAYNEAFRALCRDARRQLLEERARQAESTEPPSQALPTAQAG
jgi:hypothetical protein